MYLLIFCFDVSLKIVRFGRVGNHYSNIKPSLQCQKAAMKKIQALAMVDR